MSEREPKTEADRVYEKFIDACENPKPANEFLRQMFREFGTYSGVYPDNQESEEKK